MNARHARPRASRFHRVERRDRAAQETAVLGLPPSVDDDRLALAYDIVVPPPHRRLDRLAPRGPVLDAVFVFPRHRGPGTPAPPCLGRRGVQNLTGDLRPARVT